MPIRYTKHNSLLKNRKLAKARENKFVGVKWKDRRDVLVKPYEFDHPFIQRAPDGRVSRSYYEFTLRKNKTLLVVDINKLDTVTDEDDEYTNTWLNCERASARIMRNEGAAGCFAWALRKNSRTHKNYLCIALADDVVYDVEVQKQLEEFARQIFRNIRNMEHNLHSDTKQAVVHFDPIQKLK